MRLSPIRWAREAAVRAPKGTYRKSNNIGLSVADQAQLWLFRAPQGSPHDTHRRDIVNPALCHEALDLIQATSSLPPPGTCDVIDLNPGASVWSDALHQVLKPRRHILLELEKARYAHAIHPLLQRPGSHYRHASSLLDAFSLDRDLLSPEFRSYHRQLDSEDRDKLRTSPTNQLILTANLAGRPVTWGRWMGPVSKAFLRAFYQSIASNMGAVDFKKFGLVKLLVWVPELDKYSISPRCTVYRFRNAKLLEASCHIREIVSSFPNHGRTSGQCAWHPAALENAQEVAEKQTRAGITIPEYRRQPDPDPPSIFYPPHPHNFNALHSLPTRSRLVDQYIQLFTKLHQRYQDDLERTLEERRDSPTQKALQKEGSLSTKDLDDLQKFKLLRNRMVTTHNQYLKTEDISRGVVRLERELIALRRRHPGDKGPYLRRLKHYQESGALDELKARAEILFKDVRHRVGKARDDYRALSCNPHVMAWNNRDFEPLLCHPTQDFLPHQPMTLLEITPKVDFVKRINTSLRWICFDFIVHQFDLNRNLTVKTVLEQLVGDSDSEAYKDFLAQVPSLTDPLLGGHHDLDDFNVRTLPTDTMMDIALAYENFPFRKDEGQMLIAMMGTRGRAV